MKRISLSNSEFLHLREIYQTELEKAQKRIEHLKAILKKLDSDIEGGLTETIQLEKNIKNKAAKKTLSKKAVNTKLAEPKEQDVLSVVTKSKRGRKPKVNQESEINKTRGRKPKVAVEVKPLQKRGRKPKQAADQKPVLKRGRKPKQVADQKPALKRGRKPKGESKPLKRVSRGKSVKWNEFIVNELNGKRTVAQSSEIVKEAIEKLKIKEQDLPRVKQVISGMLSKLVSTDKLLKAQKIPGSREKLYGLAEWFDEAGNILPEYTKK